MNKLLAFILTLAFISGCDKPAEVNDQNDTLPTPEYGNPAAEGFNIEGSEPEAIAMADSVMVAMGGRQSWDTTRYFKWNFFGRRDLVWDKQTGRVRIESPYDSMVYLINVEENTGKVYVKGQEIIEPDSLQKMISRGKSIWINDSYWLFMPFKLKDSGVTLTYSRQDTLKGGAPAEVLELTFDNVGDTPQNKYEVYVDKSDNLVKQWAFYADANQEAPSAIWPWDNYSTVGALKLSFNRSDDRGPKDVMIYDELPDEVFQNPDGRRWTEYEEVN